MTERWYKVNPRNSTVCGCPGRNYDWSLFCWDGSAVNQVRGHAPLLAPKPFVDDFFIVEGCQYLHVPWDFAAQGTIYRVRPNESMRAGHVYRGKLVAKQLAVKRDDGWYWVLISPDAAKGG